MERNKSLDVELRDLLLDYCRTDKQAQKIMRLDALELCEIALINYETGVLEDIPPDLLDYIDATLDNAG